MKKVSSLFILIALVSLLLPFQAIAAEKPIDINFNGGKVKTEFVLENGTTLVPVEVIADMFGMTVHWHAGMQQMTLSKDWVRIVFSPGSKHVLVNGYDHSFTAPARVINGSTYVPLRFVSEFNGKVVNWDGATRTITINDTVLEGNIKVSDAKTIYTKLQNLEITSLDYKASIFTESDSEQIMDTYANGKTMSGPELTTYVEGYANVGGYMGDLEIDLELFVSGNTEYERNIFTGEWSESEELSVGIGSAFNLINFLPKNWDDAIVEMTSDLNHQGLILELYFNPTEYSKLVSAHLTDSSIYQVNHYYILDPTTFMPKRIIIELIEEMEENYYHYTNFYFDINSINEIDEIQIPEDLKSLIK